MAERPWWQRLDGLPPNPRWLKDNRLTTIGVMGTLICAVNFVLRVAFADQTGGLAWVWAVLAAPFIVMLVVGLRRG